MGGSKEAAAKRRATMIAKYGGLANYLAHQREAGARGGENSGKNSPTNFANNPRLAKRAAKASHQPGSRRANVDQPDSVRAKQYRNEPDPGDMPATIPPSDMSIKLHRDVRRAGGGKVTKQQPAQKRRK